MTKETESFEDGLGLIPYGGEILSGVVKVWDFASSFGQEDPQKYENEWLQKQIDVLKEYVKDVNQSLNELRARLGHDENMTRLSWLELYTGDTAGMAGDIRFRLSLRPIDADERKILAHQAFGLAAKFLLQDPLTGEMADIWKWTTLHEVRRFHDDNTAIDLTVDALDADFKVALVLPIYAYVLILCIATIDLDTGGDWSPCANAMVRNWSATSRRPTRRRAYHGPWPTRSGLAYLAWWNRTTFTPTLPASVFFISAART
jgi:hypothetical protein